MSLFYFSPQFALCTGLLLAPVGAALAQAPVITTIVPMANAQAASRTGPLTVGFSQPLAASSAGALQVFSNQRGGQRTRGTSPAVVSGNTLSFTPTALPFMPGERVQYTVTTAAASGGGALAQPRAGQFTAAVDGTGRGDFQIGSDLRLSGWPSQMITGDIDGDGGLDLLLMTDVRDDAQMPQLRMLLNDGRGTFRSGQSLVRDASTRLALGDVDGDGDLDLLATDTFNNAVDIYLNDGHGQFSSAPSVSVGAYPTEVAVGDVDADGDLDVLTANAGFPYGSVSVRLNNGSGTFGGSQDVRIGYNPNSLHLADMNGDGSLDILISASGLLLLRTNDGRGTFALNNNSAVNGSYTLPGIGGFLAPVDIDGDGDLDLLVTVYSSIIGNITNIFVFMNDGSGALRYDHAALIGNSTSEYYQVASGDVDSDGDIDVVAVGYGGGGGSRVLLNNGSGTFTTSNKSVGIGQCYTLTLGDVDGDGDLDLFSINSADTRSSFMSVRLNGGTDQPATGPTDLALFPSPARDHATLIGATPNTRFTVLDVLGRTVLTDVTGNDGTAQLVLPPQLAGGLYLVRTSGYTLRLVVE